MLDRSRRSGPRSRTTESTSDAPRGIWLPECAFAPGIDRILAENGIQFFFMDAHGIMNGSRLPKFGVHAPIRTPAGCALFARDTDTSKQVWSSKEGDPGDAAYREFYRDMGYDLGLGRNLGIKYHRITGNVQLHEKQPYDPDAALGKATEHAWHFKYHREQQAKHLKGKLGRPPVILAPYDAELFGHWWFQGRSSSGALPRDGDLGRAPRPRARRLARDPNLQTLEPAGSWGDKGLHEVWLNGTNDWIYRHQRVAGADGRAGEAPAGSALSSRAQPGARDPPAPVQRLGVHHGHRRGRPLRPQALQGYGAVHPPRKSGNDRRRFPRRLRVEGLHLPENGLWRHPILTIDLCRQMR